jgi:hypothetical protein
MLGSQSDHTVRNSPIKDFRESLTRVSRLSVPVKLQERRRQLETM